MSGKQDLVVKMTINSQDFDAGLKNAKSEMNKFSSTASSAGNSINAVMSGIVKKIGLVGIALKAVDGFKQFATSTEQMADAFHNEMGAMTDSWKSFLFQVNNGNFQGFQDIIDYARQARQALDELGDAAALFSLDNAQTSARATELLSTIQRKRKSGEDYSQEIVDYNALVSQMRKDNELANKKSMEALAGMFGQKGINVGDYGVTYMEAARLARQAAAGAFEDVNVLSKAYNTKVDLDDVSDFSADVPKSKVQQLREDWGKSRFNRADFLRTLANIPTADKEAIEKVLSEMSQRDNAVAQMEKALNRYLQPEKGGSGGTTAKSGGLTWEQQMEMMTRQMQRVPITNDTIIPLEELIEYEDIIEEDTDALCASVQARIEAWAALNEEVKMGIQTFAAFGSIMTSIGTLADDDMFARIGQSLSSIASQASSTISTLMALSGAQTIEGITEVFSSTPGLTFAKVAMTATALAGILGMVATAKSAFAGSYANGGVVPGTSYSGDKLWARVNSGEMILSRSQQAALGSGGGTVKFVIEGSQLKGVLDNYESIEAM